MDIYEKTTYFYERVKTEKQIIGKSLFGRALYAVKIGHGNPVGIVQYGIHGREYAVAELAFVHYEEGVGRGSIWLLPLMNPDGALLSERGLESVKNAAEKSYLLELNAGSSDFSLWKANGRGVDLNVNFPARWGMGEKNVKTAGAENYIGAKPFSEPETLALKEFTERICPHYTVSYHTKGEEIYWYFYQSIRTCPRDKELAMKISQTTGYPLRHAKNSAGGYKDWCISRLGIPAFTIEAGSDTFSHPLELEGIVDIITKNKSVLRVLSEGVWKELCEN